MHSKRNSEIKYVLGNMNLSNNILPIFDNTVIEFFDEISQEVKKDKKNFKYSDLITFGFWCRKSNINNLKKNYYSKNISLGRGNIFHIAPSNVPMNFAYSLAFGLLSGNNNIVRISSRKFFQVDILCKILKKIIYKKKFKSLKNRICLIKYEKSDLISAQISSKSDGRLIWGGDETINLFKKFTTPPRCIDLTFPNRYSFMIIGTNKISDFRETKLNNMINRFYNDAYLMDQQGCSSPQSIIWVGKNSKKIQKLFWKKLNNIVALKYANDISVASKKFSRISSAAIESDQIFKLEFNNFNLAKLKMSKLDKNLDKIQCHFGTFVEGSFKNLDEVKNIITNKFQTLIYYGIDHKEVKNFIFESKLKGIDRIVPVGRAFDMGLIWDGYDIIKNLSRSIGE
ncbi:acyl-CoA reductase [Pelagibacteraceae bacterium]|nr:acyl-CoA reductase [Pelagibacteraceae bacterium]